MILATMRFASFEWKINPTSLQVSHDLEIESGVIPRKGQRVLSTSRKVSLCKGEGEFVGSDCIERYRMLEQLCLRKEKGILTLPGQMPFEAYFTHLSLVCGTENDVVRYRFEFCRDMTKTNENNSQKVHICKEGESLYDISYREGVPVETLLVLNPQVRWISSMRAGEQVKLC